ncbi:MAG: hypothetical protein U9R68_09195, partial [Planctomycetota bacterium]|nr:hypothetical protein [Planctomycetota bacterium]
MHGPARPLVLAMALVALLTAAAADAAKPPRPADDLAVLSPEEQPGEMLRAYLLDACDECFDARCKEVDALETADAVRRRIDRVRKDWMEAIGPFPDRTPLNARTLGTIKADGYRIEKVLYESRPDHHVTANLYVPA